MKISRRSFLKTATAIGASLAWVGPAQGSRIQWHERRDLYPQGVASGDPDPHSVILWTRRPFTDGTRQLLTVEVAEDEAFRRVIGHARGVEVVIAEDDEVGELAGLDRAERRLFLQEPAVLRRVETQRFHARELLSGVDERSVERLASDHVRDDQPRVQRRDLR